jgi:ketosteroid isomerase-like protein
MVNAQESATTIRRGYELFNSGNLEELTQIFAEDVVWHAGGGVASAARSAGATRPSSTLASSAS